MGGKSKKTTIGHRYFMGVHMALGRGPINSIEEVRVGDKTALKQSITGNTEVQIDQPDLFGGEEKEGGIQGPMAVLMGAPSQGVHAMLAAMLGGLVPAFRGVATVFFDGLICAMSPYPKPWAFRVRRTTAGWQGDVPWYSAKCKVELDGGAVHAMNPAHILYQVLTDRGFGRGLPAARLDDAAWRAAADIFHAEGMGLCFKWSRQDDVTNFCQSVLDHAGAVLYTSRSTGLLVLKPIRSDYDVDDLPHFTYDSGLLGIDEDQAASQVGGINEVVVQWLDPVRKEERQTRAKNVGAILAAGGAVHSSSKDFFGVPTAGLAQRVAERELRVQSGFVRKLEVRLDRRGKDIMPGHAFCVSDPSRGISKIVLRAGRVDFGTLTDGTITIVAPQDIFGLGATRHIEPEPPGYTPPNSLPIATTLRKAIEAPYRELVRDLGDAQAQAQDPTAAYVLVSAVKPTSLALGFELATRVGSAAFTTTDTDGLYSPSGVLATAITPGSTTATLVGATDIGDMRVGSAAMLGDEIVRIDAINTTTGRITLGRGCIDTTPRAHAAGTRLWAYDERSGAPEVEYTTGVTVDVRTLTRTNSGLLGIDTAPTDTITLAGRAARPYPPGRLRINGQAWPQEMEGAITLSWASRNRITQSDQLIDSDAGPVTPEPDTTYRVTVTNATTAALLFESAAITGQTFTLPVLPADGPITVGIRSQRQGLSSWQMLQHSGMYYRLPPLRDEAGDVLHDEDGHPLIEE